jgi:putative flippase GtrA
MGSNYMASQAIMRSQRICNQFMKYLSVGGISNALAYFLYIIITLLGIPSVTSMTIVYVVAGGLSFVVNKSWTFRSGARTGSTLAKYIVAQLLGYLTNLLLLAGLHYGLGMPHYFAQLVGIGLVAIELFLLSRYYVFI